MFIIEHEFHKKIEFLQSVLKLLQTTISTKVYLVAPLFYELPILLLNELYREYKKNGNRTLDCSSSHFHNREDQAFIFWM